jgi:AbrB family looped-hinge helix DNA binding protein
MEQEETEAEIAVVGTKGQLVIPQKFRKALNIKSKTNMVVYRKDDKLVLAKLKVPSIEEEFKAIFKEVDKQFEGRKKPTEEEIIEKIQALRRSKRAK